MNFSIKNRGKQIFSTKITESFEKTLKLSKELYKKRGKILDRGQKQIYKLHPTCSFILYIPNYGKSTISWD
ncbi:hypothetical protein TRIP_D300156 [uncultured Paludibacter sp.]|uniref:Uncharacterized protein n=1 Tax=uncultured Paludibacter sp. TaxID=497635 RepID=A0A653ABB1_9BACT|nr:hypothetical protein TRIP_D300156 [uncultured Paludibacter sp.]